MKDNSEKDPLRRSSFFSGRRLSFFRSKGASGANVETLRGHGADFEGSCRVTRGNRSPFFACFGSPNTEPNKKRYVLVKGTNLFVFVREDSPSPKYAIDLAHKTVNLHPISGHSQIVTIEDGFGDIDYKFRFELRENSDLAKNFSNVLKETIAMSDTNEVKDKLGHKRSQCSKSVKYANTIAAEKERDCPSKPISAAEIMSNDPTTAIVF
jgi:hypothetical protein